MNLIDLHSHILPGLDDGAARLDEALEMARIAVADGIGIMAATPHAPAVPGHPIFMADVATAVAELQARLDDQGIPLQLVPGAEVALMPETARQLIGGDLAPIARSRYVLVEFPLLTLPAGVFDELFKLRMAGLVPIIAHPERHPYIQEDPRLLERMVAMGCLAQATAMSITGNFGSAAMECVHGLLMRGLVHLVASDAHNIRSRPPMISDAFPWVADILEDREEAQRIFLQRPADILKNRPVRAAEAAGPGFRARAAAGEDRPLI